MKSFGVKAPERLLQDVARCLPQSNYGNRSELIRALLRRFVADIDTKMEINT